MLIPKTMRFDNPSDFKYHGTSSAPPYAGTMDLFSRYALSKLANILFTAALQERYDNILCTSCNPGGTNTAGGMSVWPAFLRPIMSRLFVAPAVGALPVLFLAGGNDVAADKDRYKAIYLGNKCKVEEPSVFARDSKMAENLWKLSEEVLTKWIKK
jgi:NAD(P)-dependent dehydrogenase (short-subunit alcohol dehydrogenase family)